MKRHLALILFAVLILLVISQLRTFFYDPTHALQNVGKLRYGDTAERVLELLGKPISRREECGSVTLDGKAQARAAGTCGQIWRYGRLGSSPRLEISLNADEQVRTVIIIGQKERLTTDFFSDPRFASFEISLYNYLDRPIFDITLNGKILESKPLPPHNGKRSMISMPMVALGKQTLTWRLGGSEDSPGYGDTIEAVNQATLQAPGAEEVYLGIHIYPDNTVEFVPEKNWPEQTARGEAINRQWKLEHGQ